jgi:aryl-alcohol dehydrogenase-like predicted oxidoreductase
MRYKLLGPSGIRVSELALGTMTFGENWGWGAPKDESRRILERFAEAGGNFVDTSNNYTDGTAETFLGEFLAPDRDHFVLATKFSLTTRRDDPNAGGNHPKNMVQALEASLRRLRTDRIDLFWLHMWDSTTPVEEILRTMDVLVRQGKVLHVGFSDTPAWVISQASTIAELRGWVRPVAVQLPYSIADRDPERDLLPMARAFGMAVTAWGVLGGGVLTGKYGEESAEKRRYGDDPQSERELSLAKEIRAVADDLDRLPSQVAINWVRHQDQGTLVPILGARTERQVVENLTCLDFDLSEDQLRRLDEVSAIPLGFPNSFLASENVQRLIFGETAEAIDRPRRTPR